jgi:CheY-like chemotaxis protein
MTSYLKSCRILIVDDDEDNRTNLADILADHGFRIETAADGDIALEKLQNALFEDGQFSLCLLDFKLPKMDGVELYEKIVASQPGLQAIMITAYAGDDGVQRAIAAGTWKVLRKPVDVKLLLGLIDEIVSWAT